MPEHIIPQAIPQAKAAKPDCAWCWKALYPCTPFPVGVSSTICREHANWMARQAGLRRQQKIQQEGKHHV